MLKNRVLTAAILAPLFIVAVLYLPGLWFALLFAGVMLLAAWEWSDLSGLDSWKGRGIFVLLLAAIMSTGPHWYDYTGDWLPWLVIAFWTIVGVFIRRNPAKLLAFKYPVGLKLGIGAFVLLTAWIQLVWLRTNLGEYSVLYLFLVIWLADIAAYFGGKQWGITKLSPDISPGKTVEGMYAALVAVALFALGVGLFKEFKALMVVDFVFLTIVTAVISVVGDLFESLVKRIRGVKDSGGLLPGHGGVLDRIDSLIAAVSVFYAGSALREIFLQ